MYGYEHCATAAAAAAAAAAGAAAAAAASSISCFILNLFFEAETSVRA